MDVDDFQNLYNLLRGSRSAMAVLDARALFSEKKLDAAHLKLTEAREVYAESRARVLKQDPEKQIDAKAKDRDRQLKKAKRKQEKARETLEAFDELLPALMKSAERQNERLARVSARAETEPSEDDSESQPEPARIDLDAGSEFDSSDDGASSASQSDSPEPKDAAPMARPADVEKEFFESYARCEGDERLDLIGQRFGFREVREETDLHGDALYFIQTSSRTLLVSTPPEIESEVSLVNLIDGRPIKPVPRAAFLKLGRKRKMVLLTCLETPTDPDSGSGSVDGLGDAEQVDDESSTDIANDASEPARSVLDMGAFSQLLTAAQRSGIVPGADQIGHVRDREFRMGKHDQAFQAIDSMFSRFSASASQRTQRIAREDADISSGRIKMSPKDLQAKRTRDRTQTQEVDRAMRRFQVVLEGLRVLMNDG
ncbi:MAG: hypothetical protein ACR2NZ_07230 [Rubripirellula sp.]